MDINTEDFQDADYEEQAEALSELLNDPDTDLYAVFKTLLVCVEIMNGNIEEIAHDIDLDEVDVMEHVCREFMAKLGVVRMERN